MRFCFLKCKNDFVSVSWKSWRLYLTNASLFKLQFKNELQFAEATEQALRKRQKSRKNEHPTGWGSKEKLWWSHGPARAFRTVISICPCEQSVVKSAVILLNKFIRKFRISSILGEKKWLIRAMFDVSFNQWTTTISSGRSYANCHMTVQGLDLTEKTPYNITIT